MFPTKLSEYKVVKSLASGTYGEVLEVEYDGKPYVLKSQNGHKEDDQGISAAALTETDIMRRLVHPNLAKALKIFIDTQSAAESKKVFILMEKAISNLTEFIDVTNKSGFTRKEFVLFVHDIFCSLEFLHRMGYIHADVKTVNFLVFTAPKTVSRPGGRQVRLADFGLTKRVTRAVKEYAMTGYYRAPEIMEGGTYGTAADIWGVGVTLFYMLFDDEPIPEQDDEKALPKFKQHLEAKDFVESVKSETGQGPDFIDANIRYAKHLLGEDYDLVVDLMMRCLVLDPAKRITATEALELPLFKGFECPPGSLDEGDLTTRSFPLASSLYRNLENFSILDSTKVLTIDLFERYTALLDLDKDPFFKRDEFAAILCACYIIATRLDSGYRFTLELIRDDLNALTSMFYASKYTPEAVLCLQELIVEDLDFVLFPDNLATTCFPKTGEALRFVLKMERLRGDDELVELFRERNFAELCDVV